MALTVVVEDSVNDEIYSIPLLVLGVVPSVVYLIVAPFVSQDIVTNCAEVYVPAGRPKMGVATTGGGFTVIEKSAVLVTPPSE